MKKARLGGFRKKRSVQVLFTSDVTVDVGMTFRVPPFGTLGTAQYGDTEETCIEARKAHDS